MHSDCVVLNITPRGDGEWRAVDARGVFRAEGLGNEIYQAELRKELLSLGFSRNAAIALRRSSSQIVLRSAV